MPALPKQPHVKPGGLDDFSGKRMPVVPQRPHVKPSGLDDVPAPVAVKVTADRVHGQGDIADQVKGTARVTEPRVAAQPHLAGPRHVFRGNVESKKCAKLRIKQTLAGETKA